MIEAFLLGIALAMDSMTMSIVNGLKYRNYNKNNMLLSSFFFGLFQGLMPLLGYFILLPFIKYIEDYDHWVVLIVLSILGLKMIKESLAEKDIIEKTEDFTFSIMIIESIATAIDALSSCVILPGLNISPYLSCFIIFFVTFIICIFGHTVGKKAGSYLKDKAGIVGGIILILLGIKCVLEHLKII